MSIAETRTLLGANDGHAVAQGHKSSREPRMAMLRTISLIHGDNRYTGRIRNVSASGALIEGVIDAPAGTVFTVEFGKSFRVNGLCRWSHEDKMGIEFSEAISVDRIRSGDRPAPSIIKRDTEKNEKPKRRQTG